MVDNNEEGRINVDSFDFANEGASEETPMLVNYLITRLPQAMANPALVKFNNFKLMGLFLLTKKREFLRSLLERLPKEEPLSGSLPTPSGIAVASGYPSLVSAQGEKGVDHGDSLCTDTKKVGKADVVEPEEDPGINCLSMVLEYYDEESQEFVAVKVIRSAKKYREATMIEIDILHTLAEKDRSCFRGYVQIKRWFDYINHICIVSFKTYIYRQVFKRLDSCLYDFLRASDYRSLSLDLVRKFGR
ncbi:hypothetical protein L7F22_068747 [Adiantum nelumboides]|nr:hypothetical protein [Adiantum nelumboides]